MVFMVQLFWLKGGINMIKRSGNELTQQSYQALFFFFCLSTEKEWTD